MEDAPAEAHGVDGRELARSLWKSWSTDKIVPGFGELEEAFENTRAPQEFRELAHDLVSNVSSLARLSSTSPTPGIRHLGADASKDQLARARFADHAVPPEPISPGNASPTTLRALQLLRAEEDASSDPTAAHGWAGATDASKQAVIDRGWAVVVDNRRGGFPQYRTTVVGRSIYLGHLQDGAGAHAVKPKAKTKRTAKRAKKPVAPPPKQPPKVSTITGAPLSPAALAAFGRNFPYHLERRERSGSQRNAEQGASYAVLADAAPDQPLAFVDILGADHEIEWVPGSLRPGEQQRVEDRLGVAMAVLQSVSDDDDDDAPRHGAEVTAQVELAAARTRHLRERTPPSGRELDDFRRAVAPIIRDLADPFDAPARSVPGIIATLEALQLGGAAHDVSVYLRKPELPTPTFLESIVEQAITSRSLVDVEVTGDSILVPHEGLRGAQQDRVLAARRGGLAELRMVELPAGGIEVAHGVQFSGDIGRQLRSELAGSIVFHQAEDEDEVRQLQLALSDLAEWLRRAPPRLDAARRGLALAGALLDSWGCRSTERAELLTEYRQAWQTFDAARVELTAALPVPESAAQAVHVAEQSMLRILAAAQTCAEGQQGLNFAAVAAVSRPSTTIADTLKLSLQAEALPETITTRDQLFGARQLAMDDDEVVVSYVGEIGGKHAAPNRLVLHLSPHDSARLRVSGQIVDGAGLVTASFPWVVLERDCLDRLDGKWLATRFNQGSDTTAPTEFGELAVPLDSQAPGALRQLGRVVEELRRGFDVRVVRSGHGFRVVDLLSMGRGPFLEVPAGTRLVTFTIQARQDGPAQPPALGDIDREPLLVHLRQRQRVDLRRVLTDSIVTAVEEAFRRAGDE